MPNELENIVERIAAGVMSNKNLSAAAMAGCQIEYVFKKDKVIAKTKNPVAVHYLPDGGIIVGEKIGEEIKVVTMERKKIK